MSCNNKIRTISETRPNEILIEYGNLFLKVSYDFCSNTIQFSFKDNDTHSLKYFEPIIKNIMSEHLYDYMDITTLQNISDKIINKMRHDISLGQINNMCYNIQRQYINDT